MTEKQYNHEPRATSHEPGSYPLISVIVPVYNVEKYLDRCVQSILNQTYTNFEVILVDDGSPDNCPAICDNWALKAPRIRVIHKSNGGLSSARNAGLDIAKGEYIGFIDSDDFITPDMYAKLFRLLTENNADAAICSFQRVNEEGEAIQSADTLDYEVLSGEDALEKYMTVQWKYCLAWNKLCRASVYSDLRFPEGRIHEDNATIHRILAKCRKVVTTSQAFYMYASRPGSIMQTIGSSLNVREVDEWLYIYEDMYTFFSETGRKSQRTQNEAQTRKAPARCPPKHRTHTLSTFMFYNAPYPNSGGIFYVHA